MRDMKLSRPERNAQTKQRNANRRAVRRTAAELLIKGRNGVSHRQQLARLDSLFGKGQGARRERSRLLAKLA